MSDFKEGQFFPGMLVGIIAAVLSIALAHYRATNASAAAPTPEPTPVTVRCLLDSNQIARFSTYFTPASE